MGNFTFSPCCPTYIPDLVEQVAGYTASKCGFVQPMEPAPTIPTYYLNTSYSDTGTTSTDEGTSTCGETVVDSVYSTAWNNTGTGVVNYSTGMATCTSSFSSSFMQTNVCCGVDTEGTGHLVTDTGNYAATGSYTVVCTFLDGCGNSDIANTGCSGSETLCAGDPDNPGKTVTYTTCVFADGTCQDGPSAGCPGGYGEGSGTTTYSNELTIDQVYDKAVSNIPSSYTPGTGGADYHINSSQTTVVVQKAQYQFRYRPSLSGYTINWNETFTPDGGGMPTSTAKSFTVTGGPVPPTFNPGDSTTWPTTMFYTLNVPSSPGTLDVSNITVSMPCST